MSTATASKKRPARAARSKQWKARGIAGCVEEKRTKSTGTHVGVYQAHQLGLKLGRTRWLVECEEHGEVRSTRSLVDARRRARAPMSWCEGCRSLVGAA
jgi:hypothetical protein